jgi:hypothetical protein
MKNTLLALTLSSSAALFADCCCESSCGCCYEEPRCCEEKPPINCECYTPAFYDLDCDCGLIFDAEFLYWYARETNLAYAVKFGLVPEIFPTTPFNPNALEKAFPSSYRHLKAKWGPGVRLGVGANSGCDGWDYYLNWTYFHNKSRNSTSASFAGQIPESSESGVLDLWQTPALTPIYDKVSAKWRLNFNQIDLELGRKYWLSECFNLRPYVALRGAWTRTRFEVKGALGPKTISSTLTQERVKDRFKNTNWGVGFLAGLQPTWYFCSNFALYGDLDVALTWGEFESKKKARYIDSLSASSSAGSSFDISNTSREDFYSMNTIVDLGIGLRWEETWCCNQYRTSLDLGWEHHVWFDHSLRHKPIGSVTNGIFEYFTNTVDVPSNLVYGGFVLRARFDF